MGRLGSESKPRIRSGTAAASRFFRSQDENRQLPRETQQSNGSNAHYDCARPTQHFHP
jgi:hypothetical protein